MWGVGANMALKKEERFSVVSESKNELEDEAA